MKKMLIASSVLLPALVGCGGATNANQRHLQTSCSMMLRADAAAEEVQQAVNAALAGDVDPCGGAVDQTHLQRIELESIDEAQAAGGKQVLALVFRVFLDEASDDAVDLARPNVNLNRAHVNLVGPRASAAVNAAAVHLDTASARLNVSLSRTHLQ